MAKSFLQYQLINFNLTFLGKTMEALKVSNHFIKQET